MDIMESHKTNMPIVLQIPVRVALLCDISFCIACDSTMLLHSGTLFSFQSLIRTLSSLSIFFINIFRTEFTHESPMSFTHESPMSFSE